MGKRMAISDLSRPARPLLALILALPLPAADLGYASDIAPILQRHCVACHGPEKQKARLRLDGPEPDLRQAAQRELWDDVHAALVGGLMPPPEQPRPTADELDLLTRWIATERERGEIAERGGAGRTALRRLTRAEYLRVVEDALGLEFRNVPLDLAARLPSDPKGGAYVNEAELLNFQNAHLKDAIDLNERLLRHLLLGGRDGTGTRWELDHRALPVMKNIYRLPGREGELPAVGGGPTARMRVTSDLPMDQEPLRLLPVWRGDPGYQGRDKLSEEAIWIEVPYIPPHGVLHLRIRAGAVIPAGEGAPVLRVALQDNLINQRVGKEIASFPVTAPADAPVDHDLEIPLDLIDFPYHQFERQGKTCLRIFNDYAPIANRDPALAKAPKPQQKGDKPATPPWPWQEPLLLIDRITLTAPGPAVADQRRRRLLEPGKDLGEDADRAERIVQAVAERAWRRAVTSAELAGFLELYRARRAAGEDAEAALIQPLTAVLVSAHASHRIERKASAPAPLSGDELASRLALFLWGRGPDAELRGLAASGRLREPAVLRAQCERLLADPRSAVFVADFVRQWLALDRIRDDPIDLGLGRTTPDQNAMLAERREERLKADLAAEPIAWFGHLLAGNAPLARLLASEEVLVNDRLSAYYGIAGVVGGGFRPVAAPADRRQGLLSMAGVIAAATRGEKEGVIHRGVFLLARLLGDPPGAPAGNVQPLAEQDKADKKRRARLTLREKLLLHTEDPTCQLCHRKIDPLGFAWAAYDERGVLLRGLAKPGAPPPAAPDCTGSLPDGRPFTGLDSLALELGSGAGQPRYRFDEVLLRQLLAYGLSRRIGLADAPLIDELLRQARAEGAGLRDLVIAVATCSAFTHG